MLKKLGFSVIYWLGFTLLLTTIRFYGIEYFVTGELIISAATIYYYSTMSGIFLGLFWLLIERIVKHSRLHTVEHFGFYALGVVTVYTVSLYAIMCFSALILSGSLQDTIDYCLAPHALSNMLFALLAAFLLVFIQQIDQRMGPGNLLKFLSGKYFHPTEEERIFMFLDLKSSTTLAESIGHKKYSKLIQDCFSLLSQPILSTHAEVYQYVGDEVVLSWETNKGLDRSNCLTFYRSYAKVLEKHAPFFQEKYGVLPRFKAAADLGLVMTTEVGKIKSEIAYHGDVLNTASRLQGMCNLLDEDLLITKRLADRLPLQEHQLVDHGQHLLRGKKHALGVYGVRWKINEKAVSV